jgi:hypothetical protein
MQVCEGPSLKLYTEVTNSLNLLTALDTESESVSTDGRLVRSEAGRMDWPSTSRSSCSLVECFARNNGGITVLRFWLQEGVASNSEV